jgi:hypothetical protein
MLRLVHERDDADDFDERGYGRQEARIREDRRAHYAEQRRPSVFVRIVRMLALCVAFCIVAALAYLAGQSRLLGPLLANLDVPVVAVPAPAAQRPAPTPPAGAVTVPTVAVNAPAAKAVPSQPPVPNVMGLAMLVRDAIVALHQANVTGNYAVFRALAAPGFQQNSTDQLAKAFTDLRSAKLDLAQVAAVNPMLYSQPAIDKDGLLQLRGYIPFGDARTNFEMAFQMVQGRWRLFGIGVYPPGKDDKPIPKAKAPSAKTIPSHTDLVATIRSSVLALNQANRTGDYSVLNGLGSKNFRAENPPEKLAAAFANMRNAGVDLTPILVIDPRLFRPAALDKNGYLRIQGYFPSQPEQVNFDLVFQFEGGAWRLFGLGVDSSREQPTTAAATP